jgi:amino acid adenylation domain-containing protein
VTTVSNRSLGSRFFEHATAHPDAVALVIGRREYTYAETALTVRRWAAGLVEACGGRPGRVGVLARRSEVGYLGVLAALYAGAAFVPLNPRFPTMRTRMMVEQAELDAIIADPGSAHLLADVTGGLSSPSVVLLPGGGALSGPVDGMVVLDEADMASAAPLCDVATTASDDLAYLLFTSGSTGTPKGVPITHANVRAFLDTNQARYGIGPGDRLTQTFEQTFDLSVFDLFMAWENGAAVCAMDPIELLAPFGYLERNAITVWFSVPSVAGLLSRRGVLTLGTMPTLRWSLFCGETLPRTLAEQWQAAAANSVVENLYGPTELTIACSVYRWDPRTSPDECVLDNVPIGQPYPGLHGLVLDERLRPVADGETGELCVAGAQTTPGYWRAPHLTAQHFCELGGRTYYRTGDLVRRHGRTLVFVGRRDQQVKIGGHRVELAEIEAVLRRAGSAEAVCLLWPDADSITAVVTPGGEPQELSDAAAAALPAYMVPKSVHLIEEMPVNANGKTDRGALRAWLETRSAAHA